MDLPTTSPRPTMSQATASFDDAVTGVFEPALSVQQLAEELHVSAQTIYDPRSQAAAPPASGSDAICDSASPRSRPGSPALRARIRLTPGRFDAMSGRPRIGIGTYGSIHVVQKGRKRFRAHTRYRDVDGCRRQVTATSTSRNNAVSELKNRLLTRPGYGRGGMLNLTSPFGELAELWLADLAQREISDGTEKGYRAPTLVLETAHCGPALPMDPCWPSPSPTRRPRCSRNWTLPTITTQPE